MYGNLYRDFEKEFSRHHQTKRAMEAFAQNNLHTVSHYRTIPHLPWQKYFGQYRVVKTRLELKFMLKQGEQQDELNYGVERRKKA